METIIKAGHINVQAQTKINKSSSVSNLWENVESNRFGIIPILLLIIGCVGGIAAAFGAKDDVIRLSLIAFPTIISLALILAVAPMSWIIRLSALAVLADLAVLLF
jgi:hypothetical protein